MFKFESISFKFCICIYVYSIGNPVKVLHMLSRTTNSLNTREDLNKVLHVDYNQNIERLT